MIGICRKHLYIYKDLNFEQSCSLYSKKTNLIFNGPWCGYNLVVEHDVTEIGTGVYMPTTIYHIINKNAIFNFS